MASMEYMLLGDNFLVGELPNWGEQAIMPRSLSVWFTTMNITGTIPRSWSYFE